MQRMWLFLLLVTLFTNQAFAGVGDVDTRQYVPENMLSQHPYNKFVRLDTNLWETGSYCTAQYISPNLILSADHCTKKHPATLYYVTDQKGNKFPVGLLYSPNTYKNMNDPGDWAVWKVDNPDYYNYDFFTVKVPEQTSGALPVMNIGYGSMRIISNEEIKILRKILKEIRDTDHRKTVDESLELLDQSLKKKDLKPLRETSYRLKSDECNIVFENCNDLSRTIPAVCENKPLAKDNTLNILGSTCDSWGGNSGGGYISRGTQDVLYGVCSHGMDGFENSADTDYLTSARQFSEKLKELIEENPPDPTPAPAPVPVTESTPASVTDTPAPAVEPENQTTTGTTETAKKPEQDEQTPEKNISEGDMAYIEQEIQNQETEVTNLGNSVQQCLDQVDTMDDAVMLSCLGNTVTYQKKKERLEQLKKSYEEAKAREQSLANRALTALSVAATGIGAMELMRGLAEQAADANADTDMSAYIETMHCTYGNGKQVTYGQTEVELPGGNSPELMKLRSEYLALASDLKERKESLGMKPGIESEEILDKTQMGLYDDELTGITGGTYESLYRAKMLESAEDQAKIDDAKSASKRRVIAGGVLTGVGVVGGAVGNSLINGKLSEMIKDNKDKRAESKANKTVIKKLKQGLKQSGLKNVDKLDFSNLDIGAMSGIIDKIDFSAMSNLKGQDATQILDTSSGSSFTSSLGGILGDQNASLFE